MKSISLYPKFLFFLGFKQLELRFLFCFLDFHAKFTIRESVQHVFHKGFRPKVVIARICTFLINVMPTDFTTQHFA